MLTRFIFLFKDHLFGASDFDLEYYWIMLFGAFRGSYKCYVVVKFFTLTDRASTMIANPVRGLLDRNPGV